MEALKTNATKLEIKFRQIGEEQRKLANLRARIQSTLDELKTKSVVEGSKSVGSALDAINDSILAIETGTSDSGLDALLEIGKQTVETEEFDAVMAE